jgi:hypothetical protein
VLYQKERLNMLRWFINYLRECFCKHDFEIEELRIVDEYREPTNERVYMRCNKCGYHKKHNKW